MLASVSFPNPEAITLHSFRAGSATTLLEKGLDSAEIREFGRWKHPSSLDRYLRRSYAIKAQTAKALNL